MNYKLSTKKETKEVLKIIFDAEDEISYHGWFKILIILIN